MSVVDLGALGTPAQLWRRWVLLAAGHAAAGTDGAEIRPGNGTGLLRVGTPECGGWLRMRRMAGNRAVLWGLHPALDAGREFRDEMRDAAPDWSYDVDSAYAAHDVGFLGWYAHGRWNAVPEPLPEPVAALVAPVRDDDAVARWWHTTWSAADEQDLADVLAEPSRSTLTAVVGRGSATRASQQLELGRVWATQQLSDAATVHLRAQIHAQMRQSPELGDRGHPARPVLLRQWARVHLVGLPFRHAVSALRTSADSPSARSGPGLVAGADDVGLDPDALRALDNVLLELRMTETDEKSGAWLFARVSSDGRQVQLERTYDGWPAWYRAPGSGPTMAALYAEMEQRAPIWCPGWASLIPTDRYQA